MPSPISWEKVKRQYGTGSKNMNWSHGNFINAQFVMIPTNHILRWGDLLNVKSVGVGSKTTQPESIKRLWCSIKAENVKFVGMTNA